MRIERCGRRRDHGRSTICSTTKDFSVDISQRYVRTTSGSTVTKQYIQIDLDNDIEKSGGGEHWHFAMIEIADVAKILRTISDAITKDEILSKELKTHFDGNVTDLERIKLAILGAL